MIERAVEILHAGGLVAFPTETVYGLGADASNPDAIARLYAVKRRPADHPVIVHIARAGQLDELARDIPAVAGTLAAAYWPGPLTLVLQRRDGRGTVGVRVPNHPLALALLDAFGGPIAAPSANRFGKVSPTTAAHVHADLGNDVDLVLDGGACTVGVESTIVDVTGREPIVLRIGGVSEDELQRLLGRKLQRKTAGEVAAPGTLPSHYAPNARVDLVAVDELEHRIKEHRAAGRNAVVLGRPTAHELYAQLRAADQPGVDVIVAVAPPDDGGINSAIRDRLQRAATR